MQHKLLRLLLLFVAVLPLTFWSCNPDDEAGPSSSQNTNANSRADGDVALRLEIPKRRMGAANMFLVKKTSDGAVNYCMEWDKSKRSQRWSAFRWDNTNCGGYVKREDNFFEDMDIPAEYCTTYENYRGSGYTRGHICASADRWNSVEANRQTFLYSNMQPQLYDFNGGIWANLEMKVRSWKPVTNPSEAMAYTADTLYVCKGGTIDHSDQIIETTRTGLLVPKYFFMAVLSKNRSTVNQGYKAIGFYLEHRDNYPSNQSLSAFIVSIDRLEELTGIDFFCNLPDAIENQVEAQVAPTAWGFQ